MFRNKVQIESLLFLIKWLVIAIFAGIIGSSIVHLFIFFLERIHDTLSLSPVPIVLLPVIGAVVTGGVFYYLQPEAAGEGIPCYIGAVNEEGGRFSFSVTVFKFLSAVATLATQGNGGIIGPLGRVSSGLLSLIQEGLAKLKIGFNEGDIRTASICGLAATVSAVFHAPIGGGILAVEIIKRDHMDYSDLFPAILASATSMYFCNLLGRDGFYTFEAPHVFMDISCMFYVVILAFSTGFSGALFTWFYIKTTQVLKRNEGKFFRKVTICSFLSAALALSVHPEILGTSQGLIKTLLSGDLTLITDQKGPIPIFLFLLVIALTKGICNCITVGSGMSAGFLGPATIIGMLLGASLSVKEGVEVGSSTYYAFVAAGFAGMLASTMNIPQAAGVITLEVFGLHYSLPAAIAIVVAFQITKHRTIYDFAVKGEKQRLVKIYMQEEEKQYERRIKNDSKQ